VTVRFNDAPTVALDFSGFGWNDRIEINKGAFIQNGWAWGVQDGVSVNKSHESSSSAYTAVNHHGQGWLANFKGSKTSEGHNSLRFSGVHKVGASESGHATSAHPSNAVLADFGSNLTDSPIQGYGGLMSKVSLVQGTVHVVVDRTGAWIDTNADGVHQTTENLLAFDAAEGVGHDSTMGYYSGRVAADLIDVAHNSVVIRVNDMPVDGNGNEYALDLSGFGADDKIEVDVGAMFASGNWYGQSSKSLVFTGNHDSWGRNNDNGSRSSNSTSITLRGYAQSDSRFRFTGTRSGGDQHQRWDTNLFLIKTYASFTVNKHFFATLGQATSQQPNPARQSWVIDGRGGMTDRISYHQYRRARGCRCQWGMD